METLPTKEAERIEVLLLEDETKRDRGSFIYTYDVFVRNWVAPFSIWPLPNTDAIRVINGEVDYNDLPYEDLNEVEKGMLFEDLRQAINQHMPDGEMLCEVMDCKTCLKERCSIFRLPNSEAGGEYGICSEFKITFRR